MSVVTGCFSSSTLSRRRSISGAREDLPREENIPFVREAHHPLAPIKETFPWTAGMLCDQKHEVMVPGGQRDVQFFQRVGPNATSHLGGSRNFTVALLGRGSFLRVSVTTALLGGSCFGTTARLGSGGWITTTAHLGRGDLDSRQRVPASRTGDRDAGLRLEFFDGAA